MTKTTFIIFRLLLILLFIAKLTAINAQKIENFCKYSILNYSYNDYKASRQNWDIAQNPMNKFMYFANSKGLLEYDGSNWKLYELPNKKIIRSVYIQADGKIFTGALGEFGFWQKSKNGLLEYHSLNHLINHKLFKSEEIWNIIPTPQGVLFQSFAFIYLYHNNSIENIKTPGNLMFMFEANQRYFIKVIDKGLFEYQNRQFTLIAAADFLKNEPITTILPASDNKNILVGTQKNIYLFDGQKLNVFNNSLNAYLAQNQLNNGIKLKNGNYALGTIQNGFVIINAQGKIIEQFNKKTNLQNNTILSLF